MSGFVSGSKYCESEKGSDGDATDSGQDEAKEVFTHKDKISNPTEIPLVKANGISGKYSKLA